MKVEFESNYGADADGRRGIATYSYQEEEEDIEQWMEAIYNEGYDELPETYEWETSCPATDIDITLTVSPTEWITEMEYQAYIKEREDD